MNEYMPYMKLYGLIVCGSACVFFVCFILLLVCCTFINGHKSLFNTI